MKLISIKILFFSCVLMLTHTGMQGQTMPSDSITSTSTNADHKKSIYRSFIAPTVLIGAGAYFTVHDQFRYYVRDERNKLYPDYHTSVDNFLPALPVAVVYGLNACGVKGKSDFINRSLILVKSEVVLLALTGSVKALTHVDRPDNSNQQSFPSAHTAHAFATATFLAHEFGDRSVWYSIGAYTLATGVGALRIMNNRHWISDVMGGAGIGILSMNVVYLTHKYKWGKKNNLTVVPSWSYGPSIYLCYKIR
jgi:membrane-associated phospholipid phosphatase